MDPGWIKLHRKIRENWIWGNSNYLKWWVDLLISANYKPIKVLINNEIKSIEQGMYHTSELKLSERWGVSRKVVRNFLKLLETDSMVTIKKSRLNGTTIKLRNYAVYQDVSDSEETTKGTTEGTTEGQAAGHQKDNAQSGYTQVGFPVDDLPDDNSRNQQGKKTKSNMSKQQQDAFENFWTEYPKKFNKGDARKAWKQIQPSSELLTKMLSALGRAKTCSRWKKDGGQYIPYPATWLRAEGWEDEANPIAPAQNFTQTYDRIET